MSNLIYPTVRGLAFPIGKTPEFSNLDSMCESGVETMVALYQNPVWHFDLKYNVLNDDPTNLYGSNPDTDLRMIMGFCLGRQDSYDDFLYLDPTDNAVVEGSLQLLEDDNGTYYSPIQRLMGGATSGFYEDVTDLVGGNVLASVSLFENGSPSSTGAVLSGPYLAVAGQSFGGLYVVWASEPTAPITATFNFYFRVRFEKDGDSEFDWDWGAPTRYSAKSIKFRTSRPPAAV